jgi:XTP/dITP diphosphohydrolase
MEIVLASANKHKLREIRELLPAGYSIKGLGDIGFNSQIDEVAETIKGNSLLKAQTVKTFLDRSGSNYAVLADDSGLEVHALEGKPGVHSARFAGAGANDAANNSKLLREMERITDRTARFLTVLTFLSGNGTHFFEGDVKGTIALAPRGNNGFGYDPLFIPQGFRSTFAELGPEIKNRISHRAVAMNKFIDLLTKL